MKPKKELIRVVKSKENEISIDLVGKKPGRGAYVCKDRACLEKAFKTNVAILFSTPESIMSSLVSQTKTANQTMHESIQSLL